MLAPSPDQFAGLPRGHFGAMRRPEQRLELVAQYPLNPYRFDFAIRRAGVQKPFLLIECDGAAFHTSPEQVDHDRRKDEWATLHGFDVIRFTGSDINSRPLECIAALAAKLPKPDEGA